MDRGADGQTWVPFHTILEILAEQNLNQPPWARQQPSVRGADGIWARYRRSIKIQPDADLDWPGQRHFITCEDVKHLLRELGVAGDHAAMVRPGESLEFQRFAWVRADAMRGIFAAHHLDPHETFWVDLKGNGEGQETLLHRAADMRNAPAVSALIAAGCDLESEFIRTDEEGDDIQWGDGELIFGPRETALGAAIRVKSVEVMRLLLAAGANPNHLNGSKQSPLECLLESFPEVSALKLLLAAGADVQYAADGWGLTPSILSFWYWLEPYQHGAAEMVRCLVKAGARPADINSAFEYAIYYDKRPSSRSVLGPLLEAGADLDYGIEFAKNPPSWKSVTAVPGWSKKSTYRYLLKVKKAGGYENLVATYRRVLTAPESALAKFIEFRFGRTAPHDVLAKVLEFWKPPGGP
jgi:hypothetical protein